MVPAAACCAVRRRRCRSCTRSGCADGSCTRRPRARLCCPLFHAAAAVLVFVRAVAPAVIVSPPLGSRLALSGALLLGGGVGVGGRGPGHVHLCSARAGAAVVQQDGPGKALLPPAQVRQGSVAPQRRGRRARPEARQHRLTELGVLAQEGPRLHRLQLHVGHRRPHGLVERRPGAHASHVAPPQGHQPLVRPGRRAQPVHFQRKVDRVGVHPVGALREPEQADALGVLPARGARVQPALGPPVRAVGENVAARAALQPVDAGPAHRCEVGGGGARVSRGARGGRAPGRCGRPRSLRPGGPPLPRPRRSSFPRAATAPALTRTRAPAVCAGVRAPPCGSSRTATGGTRHARRGRQSRAEC